MQSRFITLVFMTAISLLLAFSPCDAKRFAVGDESVDVVGYLSQTAQYSIEGDNWDVEQDLNQLLMNLLLEAAWKPSGTDNWRFFASGLLTVDWIYELKSGDSSWKKKQFNKSRHLFIDQEWWQNVKEAHVTWTPGNFTVRAGKQIVRWGEALATPVVDLINPQDFTHGFGEIEFENQLIPIPLLRVDYTSDNTYGPFQMPTLQFIFNPNVDHIPNTSEVFGNTRFGVWASELVVDDFLGFGFPGLRIGRQDVVTEEVDHFDPDYMEFGLRLSTMIGNGLYSLVGFYGRNNTPTATALADFADDTYAEMFGLAPFTFDDAGNWIINAKDWGIYPREKFIGATYQFEVPYNISSLGGYNPIISGEVAYRFDDVIARYPIYDANFFVIGVTDIESDVFKATTNVEWHAKVPWQQGFIWVLAELGYTNRLDPQGEEKDWFSWATDISSAYFRGKWITGLLISTDFDNGVIQYQPYTWYTVNEKLTLTLKANFFKGEDQDAIWMDQNKDAVVFKFVYQFN